LTTFDDKIILHLAAAGRKYRAEVHDLSRFALFVTSKDVPGGDTGHDFEECTLEIGAAEPIMLGPCRLVDESDGTNGGRSMVVTYDLHDFRSLVFKKQEAILKKTDINLALVLEHKHKIHPSFKEYVANLTYDIHVYKAMFDDLDAEYQQEPQEVRQVIQKTIIDKEGKEFLTYFDEQLGKLKNQVHDFSQEEHERHGYYFRKQIWPFIRCSPFLVRTNTKPRGYAGDSEMMMMIYKREYLGDSTFGKLLHRHQVEVPAAEAVRNRRILISRVLSELKIRRTFENRCKVLSVACGPAFELNDIVLSEDEANYFEFHLLDQDQTALDQAADMVENLEQKLNSAIQAKYILGSVRTMLTSRRLDQTWGRFDSIYSMGLFDYLIPPVAKAVLRKLIQLLEPGGELVIGNFHVTNRDRTYMEYWGDWVLYYRTEQDMLELVGDTPGIEAKITFEDTGAQMFLHLIKSVS